MGIIAVLMALLLATLEMARHRAYISACAANLHTIGQAMTMYANENHGHLPRTRYVPGAALTFGTAAASGDTFGPTGPQPNDATAAAFLLLRSQRIPPAVFICPYNDVTSFAQDDAAVTGADKRSNFSDFKANLAYSFANMYPDAAAEQKGYQWTGRLGAEFAVAADLNPGVRPPAGLTPASSTHDQKRANSINHEGGGQNVLYGDGHVAWQWSVFSGIRGDDIYINRAGQLNASPGDREDSVLVPTR
jgi:prepilin-type processing-associated H-X9-DG protein